MTPTAATSFGGTLFDTEFLRQLELLRFVSKQVQPGQIRGEHRAKRRGSGLQFADYRPYVAGDDTRHVDWRAYLRLGRLLMRLFEEEADLPIDLLVDASHSMSTGDPAKFDQARRLAGALGYIGLLNHDRVRVVAFSTGAIEELPGAAARIRCGRRSASWIVSRLTAARRCEPASTAAWRPGGARACSC